MRLPHVTWLRAFEAAARHSSFSDAAHELNLTPAAVSQQIRLLEQHLGTPLFRRLPRGVELTGMGQAYALPVRKSFTEMQTATEGLFTVRRKRKVRIRASISYATLVLAPRLKAFHDLHPEIEISLSTAVWSDRMEDEPIDVDIRYGTGHWDETEMWKLRDEVATIVCHPDHLSSFGPSPRIQDLLGSGLVTILGSEVEWRRLSDIYTLNLPEPPVWLAADSSLIAIQSIAAGFGTALINESFTQPFVERGSLVSPFEYRLPMREAYYMVMRDDTHVSEEIRIFRDWLIGQIPA
ncbi:LysR substrate-binding domain-containing protein [Sulfitobacter sp.]|uniref:LysR substrate-binding domain-containing protein n=1 Tax=Sulfitobacter sp. TaxID=1903071 RepID=UPI00329796A2